MKKPLGMIRGALGLLAWVGIGFGVAQAGVILPVSGTGLTVSIFQGGSDVTDTWLPELGQSVNIVVNGVDAGTTSISLVCPDGSLTSPCPPITTVTTAPTLATSNYPGVCTNSGANTDLSPDFTLTGTQLTPTDCGGRAVMQVTGTVSGVPTTVTFLLPQDSDNDGMPNIWEAQFCPAATPNCLEATEDLDTSVGSSVTGDGIAAFDEYRGFMVSGTHVRTHPGTHIQGQTGGKDLFVHLVNPQCSTLAGSTASFLGGGAITSATGDTLFGNVNTLISGTQIHRLGYTPNATNYTTAEWVDNFQSYSPTTGFVYRAGTDGSVSDRQINRNAVYPVTTSPGSTIQKGLRITECLDDSTTSPLGIASLGSPNGPDNAIVYTKRILKYFDNTLSATTPPLCYQTFQNGAWTTPVAISHDALIAKAIAFYVAMEIGHSVKLTPTVEGTSKTSYGYHHAPGTGSNLDQAITNKTGAKCGNLFSIPSLYNSSDQQGFVLK